MNLMSNNNNWPLGPDPAQATIDELRQKLDVALGIAIQQAERIAYLEHELSEARRRLPVPGPNGTIIIK